MIEAKYMLILKYISKCSYTMPYRDEFKTKKILDTSQKLLGSVQ